MQTSYLTLDEVQSRNAVSWERCIETAAHLTRHVLSNIFSKQRFDVLHRDRQETNEGWHLWCLKIPLDMSSPQSLMDQSFLTLGTNFPLITSRWLPSIEPVVELLWILNRKVGVIDSLIRQGYYVNSIISKKWFIHKIKWDDSTWYEERCQPFTAQIHSSDLPFQAPPS
jgi:hypothetical protein